MIRLDFLNESGVKIPKSVFSSVFKNFMEILRTRVKKLAGDKGIITIVLVDDKAIKKINAKWRKKNKPTDVISFAYLEGKKMPMTNKIGDIFISIDTAKKQAKEHLHSPNKELQILFIHGLLHLFGFDHKNDSQEKEMERWAGKILD